MRKGELQTAEKKTFAFVLQIEAEPIELASRKKKKLGAKVQSSSMKCGSEVSVEMVRGKEESNRRQTAATSKLELPR
jgi:hypothetical protein